MACLEGFLPADHKYCSAVTALDKVSCCSVVPTASPCCWSSVVAHPACKLMNPVPLSPWRCQWISCCLPAHIKVWKRPSILVSSTALARDVPVLVRGEHSGFYYHGTVKEELEGERGTFLVELAKPVAAHGKPPVRMQKATEDDILEYVNGMKHSLLPGDKVLAPWEPDMVRLGPGTVLMGIETRDSLRASEDEEITVQFWNGKKVKLPRGVALWIPRSRWERIVEMIHMPFTSRLKARENPDTNNSCVFSCSPVTALSPLCTAGSLTKQCLLRWPHLHHHRGGPCSASVHAGCICCCRAHTEAWWPLPSHSLVLPRGAEEAEPSSKSSLSLLDLESPKQEAAGAAASFPFSSSECAQEPIPAEHAVVDRAVNTDSRLLEKPKLKDSARPRWKYWKRSHHKSQPSNPGFGVHGSSYTKGRLAPEARTAAGRPCVTPTNQSAMFETVKQPPRRQLTMREILTSSPHPW